MKKLALVFAAAALCAGASQARQVPADHLWPEASYFEIAYPPGVKPPTQRHYDFLMSVLELAFRNTNTQMRMIEIPVSGPESATGIHTNVGGKPAIFSVKAESDLFKLVTTAGVTPDPHGVKVDRCEVPIDPALAEKIADLWWTILLRTRYFQPNEESIFEGDGEYHFFVERVFGDVGRSLEGWTWAAKPDTDVGALIGIVATMRQYCMTKDSNSLSKLDAQVKVLSSKLETGHS